MKKKSNNLKELLEEGIVSPAIFPETNLWIYNKKGKEYINKLKLNQNESEIQNFHSSFKNYFNLIDNTVLRNTDYYTLFTIDHDYPGKSALMQNSVFSDIKGKNVKSLFLVADPKYSSKIYSTLKRDKKYLGGGAGSGFKDKILENLDELHESSKLVGSVNAVLKSSKGNLIGFNSDGVGFRIGLEKLSGKNYFSNKKIVFLGSGGVAPPLVYEITKFNPSEIVIVNRTIQKAINLIKKFERYFPKIKFKGVGENKLTESLKDARLVINVSNKGTGKFKDYTAFARVNNSTTLNEHYKESEENISGLEKRAIVSDIVISDKKTKTLELAERKGYKIQDGKLMVLYQAVPVLENILKENKINLGLEEISKEKIEETMKRALFS